MKMIIAERKDDEGFWLILCPKEGKEVPVYHCAGSFVKGKPTCGHVQTVSISEFFRQEPRTERLSAKVECLWPEEIKDGHLAFTVGVEEIR